jgi:hypothetical protein
MNQIVRLYHLSQRYPLTLMYLKFLKMHWLLMYPSFPKYRWFP